MEKKNQQGFTLTELMMSVSVSTVLVMAIFAAMITAQNQMNTSDVAMAIETSGREGLYRMVQEIRESAPTLITISNNGETLTFNVPDPGSPVTAGYAVSWPGHSIQYTRTGAQIIRTNSTTNQTSVIANDVTGITFTGNSATPTVVTVAMTLQRNLVNGRSIPVTALSLTSQAKIRNN